MMLLKERSEETDSRDPSFYDSKAKLLSFQRIIQDYLSCICLGVIFPRTIFVNVEFFDLILISFLEFGQIFRFQQILSL